MRRFPPACRSGVPAWLRWSRRRAGSDSQTVHDECLLSDPASAIALTDGPSRQRHGLFHRRHRSRRSSSAVKRWASVTTKRIEDRVHSLTDHFDGF
jgi:hypothetical protein